MINVGLLSATRDPLLRQTEKRSGKWGNCHFRWVENATQEIDVCFVLDDLAGEQEIRCRSKSLFLVTWEPPSIKEYSKRFLNQFDGVLTFRSDLVHKGLTRTPPLLPWWVGTSGGHGQKQAHLDFDDLSVMKFGEKKPIVSCVCSRKTITDGHRKRLKFVMNLKEILGEKLEVFGLVPQEPWPDKMTQISPFQYHLAIENSSVKDYWTEKVADCFLGGALLLNHGCPNLGDYFPKESFVEIDFENVLATASIIKELLANNAFSKRAVYVEAARQDVLRKYNIIAQLSTFCEQLQNHGNSFFEGSFVNRRIVPGLTFSNRKSLVQRVRSRIRRLLGVQ